VIGRKAVSSILSVGAPAALRVLNTEVAAVIQRCHIGRTLPALMHSLLCSPLFSHPLGFDWLIAELITVRSMSLVSFILYLYPRLFCIDAGSRLLPLAGELLAVGVCYLFHTWARIYIWVAAEAAADYLEEAFGVESMAQLPADVPS
jgi:hypothetical protein